MKNAEYFLEQLNRPPKIAAGAQVTEEELDRDAASFMAFTSALGVPARVPTPAANGENTD